MPRPVKRRRVCMLPQQDRFGPLSAGTDSSDAITMQLDEYETVRLIDLEGFTQEECAEQMDIARTTVQGIYQEARRKLAEVLVNGRTLHIEGGAYQLCDGQGEGCGRGCCRHGKGGGRGR